MINEDTVLVHNSGPGASQPELQITVEWVLIMVNQALVSYRMNVLSSFTVHTHTHTSALCVPTYVYTQSIESAQGELLKLNYALARVLHTKQESDGRLPPRSPCTNSGVLLLCFYPEFAASFTFVLWKKKERLKQRTNYGTTQSVHLEENAQRKG